MPEFFYENLSSLKAVALSMVAKHAKGHVGRALLLSPRSCTERSVEISLDIVG